MENIDEYIINNIKMSDYNFFYSIGQRDGLAELAMEARYYIEKSKYNSDQELENIVSLSINEYIKLGYFKISFGKKSFN
jgi:hypothetical protein